MSSIGGVGGAGGAGGINPFASQSGETMSPQDEAAVKSFTKGMQNLFEEGITGIVQGPEGFYGSSTPGQLLSNMGKAIDAINNVMKPFTELTGWNGSETHPTFSRANEYPTNSPMGKFINQIIGDAGVGQVDGPLGSFLAAKSAIEGWEPTLKSEPADGPPFYTLSSEGGNGKTAGNPIQLMSDPANETSQTGNPLQVVFGNSILRGEALAQGLQAAAHENFPSLFPNN